MRQYEITFIIDPSLQGRQVSAAAQKYVDMLKKDGCSIVHVDEMGLRDLAYSIKNKNSGYYYCVEFQTESGSVISPVELAMRRDEQIMRFLTVKLDKYGVKYNEDKRAGKIGKVKKKEKKEDDKKEDRRRGNRNRTQNRQQQPKKKTAETKQAAAPQATEKAVEKPAEAAQPTVPETEVVTPPATEQTTKETAQPAPEAEAVTPSPATEVISEITNEEE